VADVVGGLAEALPLQNIVPVDLALSAPVLGDVIGSSGTTGDLSLTISPAGPLSGMGAADGVSVTLENPLALVAPVSGLLNTLVTPLGGLLGGIGN
jgi:hypothetical protein